jgi:hypothetical protein
MQTKAYVLEISGDERSRLLSVIEAAIYAGKQEINATLQDEPWPDYGCTVDDLLADPAQIERADPDDEFMSSDLAELVHGLRDACAFLVLLKSLKGRCEGCGSPSEKLYECDKAYLCERCSEKWENE